MRRSRSAAAWDLTALLNAADAQASLPERHLWLIRLLDWLRHAPSSAAPSDEPAGSAATEAATASPLPVRRLRHVLGVLDRNPPHRARVSALLLRFWREVDTAALFADFGFAPRTHFLGELAQRVKGRLLPLNPATTDLGELFGLLFPRSADALWLESIDDATLARIVALVGTPTAAPSTNESTSSESTIAPADRAWMTPLLDAIVFLGSAVRAAGFSGSLRPRMDAGLLADAPFRQLGRVAELVSEQAPPAADPALLPQVQYLRALLDTCRRCADSVQEHLEEHGVSINVVFEADQLRGRTHRMEQVLNCVVSPSPVRDVTLLLADLVRASRERRSLRSLFARHYSLLARKVAERSADTGHRYITRDVPEYLAMLRAALGGGAVLGVTTLVKFFVLSIALSPFWSGFGAGVNYAVSFVVIYTLHWTVATKQPAMTAPAMAEKLGDVSSDAAVHGFVDEAANLIRSQAAGVFGNLIAVTPVVLLAQWASTAAWGAPLVGRHDAEHVLATLSLLGSTPIYAAFTGVLLFSSSIIAGWVENWFVLHQLEAAIGWNPRIVDRLGANRARRVASYWRRNVSGWASNIALGMMLGVVPVVAAFFGLPVEVRHVTLSTGQLAAALGAEGWPLLHRSAFWWCLAGIPVTGILNLGVSFLLAFKVALRSRGIRLADRSRIYRAIRRRLLSRPASFVFPPRRAAA